MITIFPLNELSSYWVMNYYLLPLHLELFNGVNFILLSNGKVVTAGKNCNGPDSCIFCNFSNKYVFKSSRSIFPIIYTS